LLVCQRYIEMNPVRAGMVVHPGEYRWSSYGWNAQGEANPLIHPHSLYQALGSEASCRQAAYRELFRYGLAPGLIDEIRHVTNGNYTLGNSSFASEAAATLGRRVAPGQPGRQRKRSARVMEE